MPISIEKLLEKICERPFCSGIKSSDFERLLEHFGFVHKRTKGSHKFYVYEKSNGEKFPFTKSTHSNQNVKPKYIQMFYKLICELDLIQR